MSTETRIELEESRDVITFVSGYCFYYDAATDCLYVYEWDVRLGWVSLF